ncbi:MAG: GGDEF domain-containing protein [Roseococcus sp.]|nr:GGDEF domain-containing protein [Roseococcus sp.]
MRRAEKESAAWRDPAIGLAHAAMESLLTRRILPTPENYRVWYLYHAGTHATLRSDIDARLARGEALDEAAMAALHARHLAEEPRAEALGEVASKLENSLGAAIKLLEGAEAGATRYGTRLADFSVALQGSPTKLGAALARILADTEELCRQSRAVAQHLAERARETEALRSALAQAHEAALTDSLTGLPNRRAFGLALAAALEGPGPVSVALLDIDHFKRINDSQGHPAGDAVLRGLAQCLRDWLRETDHAARIGGEEFAVVLPRASGAEAAGLADKLRRAVAAERFLTADGRGRFGVSVSVGVAEHVRGEAAEALIGRADAALYEAKRAGRDRVMQAAPAAAVRAA